MLEKNTKKINIFRTPIHPDWSYVTSIVLVGKMIR
jgi:hypothetical protein